MKTIITFFLLVTCLYLNAQINNGNTNQSIDPPQAVITKFGTDFPGMNAQWEMHGNNYTAQYTDSKTNMGRRVVYDRNGNVLSTDAQLDKSMHPSSITDYYKKNYPNDNYDIWSSEDGNGNVTYYSKRGDNVLLFDKHGKYRSTKPIKPANASSTKK